MTSDTASPSPVHSAVETFADEAPGPVRMQVLASVTCLTLLFYLGARISEAIQIKRQDIKDNSEQLRIRLRGKGGKVRVVSLNKLGSTDLETVNLY